MIRRLSVCILLLGLLLALPFWFRSKDDIPPASENGDRLVIISAHNKAVRDEYEIAFRRHYREKYGRDVIMDFRSPGGTSDIVRYIRDRFTSEFRTAYENAPFAGPWSDRLADIYCNPSYDTHPVRQKFMDSDIGIGIDIFAGGGTFNQQRMATGGFAVDGGVQRRHPEYFSENSLPREFGGEALYDPQGRYYGVVLSTFGIFYNIDRMNEMADSVPPANWRELGDARFFNQLVLADPSKSGSANKCFEIIVQQCMAETGTPALGWCNGLNLLKRIFANARTITDSASKVVRDVAIGEAAAGTAIDTYAFAEIEWSRRSFGGTSHVEYVTPKGGTAVSTDPIQMLRGAPNRRVAEAFLDFMLSIEGQKLHGFRVGTPGGGVKSSLSRPPIRRELYDDAYREYRFEPDYQPYSSGADFVYNPRWTGRYYTLLQMVIKSLMLDSRIELRRAWQAINEAGGPEKVPMAMEKFNALPFEYEKAAEAAAGLKISGSNSAADVAARLRRWNEFARQNYIEAEKLARERK